MNCLKLRLGMHRFLNGFRFAVILSVFVTSLISMACLGEPRQQPVAAAVGDAASLKTFLQHYVEERRLDDDKATRYLDAFVDLNGDGKKEAIVHLIGRWWCGSGGCSTLILAGKGTSYTIITKLTVTRPPIRVLTNSWNGWRTLTVWVRGGGIEPGYEAELEFDGVTYPSNPSVPPARRLTEKVSGEVVIPEPSVGDAGKPLYP